MIHKKDLYASICKTDVQPDGSLHVWGYASTEARDSAGEVVTANAMRAALPDYMKWGAVREMHQPKAAGTALEAYIDNDGRTFFGAKIIDSEAIKKIEADVYKGFSIGGRVTSRDMNDESIITGLNLIEISLVDRPCNPDAVMTMYKVDEMTIKDEVNELDLKKSMCDVTDFARSLKDLEGVLSSMNYDIVYGNSEPSVIPTQFKQWLLSGVDLLVAMTTEERNEMAGRVEKLASVNNNDELTKVGAKLSAATAKVINDSVAKCRAVADGLEAISMSEKMEDTVNELLKGAAIAAGLTDCKDEEVLAKFIANQHAALLAKDADILTKSARIAELEAMPAPPKGQAKIVSKADDVTTPDGVGALAKFSPVLKTDGSLDEAATLVKAARAGLLTNA